MRQTFNCAKYFLTVLSVGLVAIVTISIIGIHSSNNYAHQEIMMANMGYEQKAIMRMNSLNQPNGIVDIVWIKVR